MKINSQREQRTYIIIGLCAILVVMGAGYAAFSSLLTINGTANISNSWCVGFDNTKENAYTPKAGITGGTAPTGSISFSGTTCSSNYQPDATLSATFKQPGDEIEYTLTIKNKSTVPASIKSILVENDSVTSDTTIPKGNVEFIIKMPESTNLAVEGETTMKVIARFQNTTNVTGPYTGESQTLNVKINTEQSDGTGGMEVTPGKFTGSIYRWSDDSLANKNSSATSSYPYVITNLTEGIDYVKNASLLNNNYYLKHDVVDDVITESYVCFVYNNAEHCMKGGIDESTLSEKPIFDANTQIIKDYQTFYNIPSWHNNSGCDYSDLQSRCYGGASEYYSVVASPDGYLTVDVEFEVGCYVKSDGSSYCYK